MRTISIIAAVMVCAAVIAASAPATKIPQPICPRDSAQMSATVYCEPRPRFEFNADFKPKRLPRRDTAPIEIGLFGKVYGTQVPSLPGLEELTIRFDRNGAIETEGLPACGRREISALATRGARRACRDSIVGAGFAHVSIEALQADPVRVPLTLFHGGVRNGTTTVLIHGSLGQPDPAVIVAPAKVRKVDEGRYGLKADLKIPAIAEGGGSLLDFSVTIARRFVDDDTRRGYLQARCVDGRLQARVAAVLQNGAIYVGTTVRACVVRREAPGTPIG
jgi:hypothetical protein